MSTWEERMATRAAARRAAANLADKILRTETEALCDEAAVRDEAARLMSEQDRDTDAGHGCACIGGPPGCSMCFCHIREEARARVNGRACRWCFPPG